MLTAWSWYPSALALFFFLPWFPAVSSSPLEVPPPAVVEDVGIAGETSTPAEPAVLPGVVMEEIPKGSALEKAGLQVGDVILSWERLPNPPANPETARGELTSYFDWLELTVEQVPRGVMVLRGRRGGEPLNLRVEPGLWEAKVRPVLSQVLEEIYWAGKAQLTSGDIEAAVGVWRSLADRTGGAGRGDLRVWIFLRLGEAWGERGDWGKAVEACREALAASEIPSVQVAAWEALGDALEMRSEYDEAEQAYISALQVNQKIRPASLSEAGSLNLLAEVACSDSATFGRET